MPRLTKIYTRTGDEGMTSLGDRSRVAKDDLRVRSYGEVDELNSALGVALSAGLDDHLQVTLASIQNDLFHLGADLAFPQTESGRVVPRIEERHVSSLERQIDTLQDTLGPLENFILPGGNQGAAALHLARAICRRAERTVVALSQNQPISEFATRYLNRLSDALFVMARYENHVKGHSEVLWNSMA